MSTRERDRERDGYYSDRNELIRERERERERDRGYLSDHNSRYDRCEHNHIYLKSFLFKKILFL